MKIDLTLLLQIAGVLHLGLMCAGLLMPRVVGMRGHLHGPEAELHEAGGRQAAHEHVEALEVAGAREIPVSTP
jgi:hypothetical protein